MAEETTSTPQPTAAKAKPAAKKEKPPAIEDKPFTEFIEQHFLPVLKDSLAQCGLSDIDLTFVQQKLAILGSDSSEQCWQVIGNWPAQKRQFTLYFLEGNITGAKAFSYANNSQIPSTIESFMIDERKVTLDLLILYTLQRLNGQKWLTRN